jgi:hypothetical protein
LNDIPGYHGYVDDIDISLYRGAYVINGLHLYRDGVKKPMLDFEKSDIQIEWKSVFRGRIVSRIQLFHPIFNYIVTNQASKTGSKPNEDDWTRALKKIVPIKINNLKIEGGEFNYNDIVESPDINLNIRQISLTATNLSNVVNKSKVLPSQVEAHAISFGNGNLVVNGNLNLLKKIPDMDVNVSLKNSDVTALNSVTLSTAGFDFERGRFELYSEFAIKNDYIKGYVKPMFHDIKIPDSLGKPNSSFLKRIWEGAITLFGFILKNKPQDSFATKIPIQGNLSDPHISLWKLITNIFVNGFISPFKSQVDNDIQFNDAQPKQVTKKEERQKRRAERDNKK